MVDGEKVLADEVPVSQVNDAVNQLDSVTQQNAALVEQMAAAASSLKGQAQDLVQVVAVFKLGATDPQDQTLPKANVRSNTANAAPFNGPERRAEGANRKNPGQRSSAAAGAAKTSAAPKPASPAKPAKARG